MRPVPRIRLAAGLHPLRRRDGRLQIGLETRVFLPDEPGVRRALDALAAGTINDLDDVPAAVRPHLVGSEQRVTGKVHVIGFGHRVGRPLVEEARGLAGRVGLDLGSHRPDVALLIGVGEPRREEVDRLVAAGVPHLVARAREGRWLLGPFVDPGLTACLRCTDAERADADPSWPVLVEQYAAATSRDRADGATEPLDPLIGQQACAWAIHDLVEYLNEGTPSTWSRTITLGPTPLDVQARDWLRHPLCGCAWDHSGCARHQQVQ